MAATIFKSLRAGGNTSLPVSQTQAEEKKTNGLRKRISSMYQLRQQHSSHGSQSNSSTTSTFSWSFRRSKSMSAIGDTAESSLRRWFRWTCGLFSGRKKGDSFAASDLEHNEGDGMLGFGQKSSWFGVFGLVRSRIRKLVSPRPSPSIPLQRFHYDSSNHAKNFDDGSSKEAF